MTDRKKIIEHINKIDQFSRQPENKWLRDELCIRFGGSSVNGDLTDEIKEIRKALQIRGKNSISYSFVTNMVLRNQLIVDNLRMENVALDLDTVDETERFYFFCVSAFYQVENILNFYYHVSHPDINELLTHIETNTATSNYPFLRTGKEKNVGDISVEKKITAFCSEFFPYTIENKDFTLKTLSELRQVRNEGLHRCDIIKQDKHEKLYNFFKYQNFNSIRKLLKKIIGKIEEEIISKDMSV